MKMTFAELKERFTEAEGSKTDGKIELIWRVVNKETGEDMAQGTVDFEAGADVKAECKKWEDMLVYLYGDDVTAEVSCPDKSKLFMEGEAAGSEWLKEFHTAIDQAKALHVSLEKTLDLIDGPSPMHKAILYLINDVDNLQKEMDERLHEWEDQDAVEVTESMDLEVLVDIPHERNADAWSNGKVYVDGDPYTVSVKWFDKPSQFGIKKGRVSKLWVSDGDNELACYDRGWVTRPRSEIAKAIVDEVLQEFN